MKHLYKFLLSIIMVAAMSFSPKTASATCKSTSGMDFSFANKCNVFTFEGKVSTSGCIKYQWKIISGTAVIATINGRVISYTFNATGSYTARLSISDTCNKCDTAIYKTVTVNCLPCNWASLKPTIGFANTCRKFTFYSGDLKDTCIKYSWTVDGKAVNSYPGNSRYMIDSFSADGNYTVCVKLTNTCKQCDTSLCVTVTAKACSTSSKCNWAATKPYFSVWDSCKTMYGYFGAANGCYKYTWKINGTVVNHDRMFSKYAITANGSYNICLTVQDTCKKCDTTFCATRNITCFTTCDLKPDFSWKADCRKVKFIATGNVSGAKYYWSFGDNSTGTNGDPSHTYVKDGVYKVCLYMTWTDPKSGATCKKEVCKEIKVQCGEPCNIKGDFQFYSSGGSVKFYASSNTGVYYDWDFGDGTTGSGKDPAHQYKKPGTYTVCVKITDKTRKCSVKICKKVVIEEPCHIRGDFSWNKTSSGAFKFKAISNTGYYYEWSFGDGTSGTGVDPTHTYSKAGTYTVCVTIYSKDKKCKTRICKTVVVSTQEKCNWAKLGANFSYSLVCPKLTLEAKNLSTTNCIKYAWGITPAGTNQTTTFYGRVQTITFNSSGTFNVCLKLYDSCHSCDTVICKTITVNCGTKCNWKSNSPYFAVWDSCKVLAGYIGFNSNLSGCFKYTWKVNGKVVSHDRYLKSYAISENGTYDLCCSVQDTCNKCDTTFCGTRTITCFKKCNWKAKYPNFTTFSAGSKCLNIEAGLNTSSAGCIRQYYSLAGVPADYDGKTYHSWTVGKPGTYNICIKLVDTCTGCDTTICKDIVVTGCCNWTGFDFTVSNNASTCTYVFTGNTTTKSCLKYQYTMSGNSGSSTTIGTNRVVDYKMTTNGTYTICMKVTDTCNKCDTSICKTVKVDCACSAKASFAIDSVTSAGVVYLHSTSSGAASYFWDFGDSSYSTSSAPGKHAYKTSGGYTICLTVIDANKTCSTTYCYTIKVNKTRSAASVSNVSVSVPVNIYPNPAASAFVITTMGNASYQIYDMNGKLVTSGNMENSISVNAENWMNGVYMVRVTNADGVGSTRIMIQK